MTVSEVASFNRTLDQELQALLRGVSLECLVCGEFVMYGRDGIHCPECGMLLGSAEQSVQSGVHVTPAG